MDFLAWITNLRSREKIVTPLPKPAWETVSLKPYNYSLQLITSQARSVQKTNFEKVDSGVLELILRRVTKLQDDLEVILKELIPFKHDAIPLPETKYLDKFVRKLKLTLKQLISEHKKLMDLIAAITDDDSKSDHTSSQRLPVSSCPNPAIPNLMRRSQLENILRTVPFLDSQQGPAVRC